MAPAVLVARGELLPESRHRRPFRKTGRDPEFRRARVDTALRRAFVE